MKSYYKIKNRLKFLKEKNLLIQKKLNRIEEKISDNEEMLKLILNFINSL